ncbi:hypothetical protein [Nitrosomonas sp. PY1]|nr:hypothetical protein [Nitrosomonas sp. PY1]
MKFLKDICFFYKNGVALKRSIELARLMKKKRECKNTLSIDRDLLVS